MQSSNPQEMVSTTVRVRDTLYETTVPQRFFRRKKWERPNPSEVKSFIPGTVLHVLAKAGQPVKAGDELAVFVAMKMHNIITAPHAGTVAEVRVAEGDRVPRGAVMFVVNG